MMSMQATVLQVQEGQLLVFNQAMSQKVVVHTADAGRFRIGDSVCIRYSGIMAMSIPPQITAINISKMSGFGYGNRLC
ncbi:hypothetical protein U6B65_12840 [Oscillospiraceae bacterium MB08-C2-2]|nr:hypothetical protein U6B65_12840 [Oscillospiraceae bacterium MB08-C2-2]